MGESRGGWREEERERLDHTSVGYTCDTGGCILRFSSFLLSEMKKVGGGGSFVLREKHPRSIVTVSIFPKNNQGAKPKKTLVFQY